jgi:alanine racemase
LTEWIQFCEATGWRGGAALHVDTGMNRLGIAAEEASALPTNTMASHIALLMSHLACADDPGHPLNAKQLARFRTLRSLFPNVPGSLANSSGIFLGPDAHHDLVRPGVALYGANPTPAHLNPMAAVVRLDGRVVQVRDVAAGESVGYGAVWTAKRPTRIAVIGLGYADGYPFAAGASDIKTGADAMVAGRRCPIAGRISMDLLAVDVTDLPADVPKRGDYATLLNEQIGVDELASRAGTIAYEILTGLGRRYRRIYAR